MGSQRNSHLYRNEAIRLFLYNRKAYDSESAVSWHDPTLAEFDWAFNPKLPRQACFELHTLKFVADADNALLIGGMRISRLKWLKLRLLRSTAPVLICPRRRSSALVLIRPSRAGP